MSRRLLALAAVTALFLLSAAGPARAQDSAGTPQAASAEDQSEYDVPLLGINSFRRGSETQLRPQLAGDLAGTRTAIFVKPLKGGETQVKVRFNNLRVPESGGRYVLWAVGPDKSYTRLGQVDRPDKRQAAKIDARTLLRDFGLFITAESDVATQLPSGPVAAMVVR